MKKYQVGNIIKTKDGDKCIIMDIKEKEAFVFNIDEMEPQDIKLEDIKSKIGDAECTTMVINGKKITRHKDEDETEENAENTEETIEAEKVTEENDASEIFSELVKMLGKAATELGNVFTKIADGEKNGKN